MKKQNKILIAMAVLLGSGSLIGTVSAQQGYYAPNGAYRDGTSFEQK